MATRDPLAAAANDAMSVAGGHTITSTLDSLPAPAMILSSSPAEARSPFIFQLPATSGRRAIIRALKDATKSRYQTGCGRKRVACRKAAFYQ
jgi:hypothetical protein